MGRVSRKRPIRYELALSSEEHAMLESVAIKIGESQAVALRRALRELYDRLILEPERTPR